MRHCDWYVVMRHLDNIAFHLGRSIHDTRCGTWWDVGQAVCAEAYGPDWMNDETFNEWEQKDDSEPPEPRFMESAKRMAGGYVPEWVYQEASE